MSTTSARAAIFEQVQIGVEGAATPGTAVPANIKLTQTKFAAKPVINSEDISEQGGKGDVDIVIGKEWSTATATGIVNATDFLYLLGMVVARPVVSGAVSEYVINQSGPDDKLTLTVEMGGTAGRARVPAMQGKSLEIKLDPEKAPTFTADLFGKKWDDTISSLTANPTRLLTSPFGPKGQSVYIADTLAGLDNAASKLDKGFLLDATFKIDSVADTVMGIEDVDSYSGTVDDKPVVSFNITVEQNSRGDAYMANLRSEKQMYCRIRLVGRTINSQQCKIEIDFPFHFADPDRGETRKVYTGSYVCRANFDGSVSGKLGTLCRIRVTQAAVATAQVNELKDLDGVQQIPPDTTGSGSN